MAEADEEFKRLFFQAVKRCLVADVPVGVFFSGGLDSSSITAAASRLHPGISTFSYGYDGSYNELPFARRVAGHYRTNHIELTENDLDLAGVLVKMQEVFDEPLADSAAIPTYLLSRQAVRRQKVALSGEGGDELLAGYDFWYRPLYMMDRLKKNTAFDNFWWLIGSHRYWRSKIGRQRLLQALRYKRGFSSLTAAHFHQNQYFDMAMIETLGLPAENLNRNFRASDEATLDDVLRSDLEICCPVILWSKPTEQPWHPVLRYAHHFWMLIWLHFALVCPGG